MRAVRDQVDPAASVAPSVARPAGLGESRFVAGHRRASGAAASAVVLDGRPTAEVVVVAVDHPFLRTVAVQSADQAVPLEAVAAEHQTVDRLQLVGPLVAAPWEAVGAVHQTVDHGPLVAVEAGRSSHQTAAAHSVAQVAPTAVAAAVADRSSRRTGSGP